MTPPERLTRDIVVIGGSAGAIEPLRTILGKLPGNFGAAIFVTIHIPSDFPSFLPSVLTSGPLPVLHPTDRAPFQRGAAYVAPADYHLLLEKGSLRLSRGARENRHRPAIDPLFRSAARAYGPRVIGIILSGQLDDGSAGLMAVKMRGGITIVQNPEEALSAEMPQNAIHYAHPDQILTADEIADFLLKATTEPLAIGIQTRGANVPNESKDESREADLEYDNSKQHMGKPSAFACPECHGVLWEIEDGQLLRFRCRVGHAYTADALHMALSESTEDSLWAAMRVMEEKAALLRRMAPRSGPNMEKKYLEEAASYDKHVAAIRRMLVENQHLLLQENPDEDVA